MKKLLALLLLSPLVAGETYSCTNELEVQYYWNSQVVYKRNGNEFISIQHNAFSFYEKDEIPMTQYNWEIYAEDESGIILLRTRNDDVRTRNDDAYKNVFTTIDVVFLNKGVIDIPDYTEFTFEILYTLLNKDLDNSIKASGSCLIIE
jgi:hypothetical protein